MNAARRTLRTAGLAALSHLALAGCGEGGATSDGVPATDGGAASSGYHDVPIPEALTGTRFDLTLAKATRPLLAGAETATYGYDGASFWGPTLILNQGDDVEIRVTNHLDEDTTTHWHGIHLPAAMDGGPHQVIAPGATWSPTFTVKNKAATYWYHPHLHMKTQEQLAYGAGGFIVVRDPEEAALALPRTYGVDDLPIVLTSRRFKPDNQLDLEAVYGDYLLTNGVLHGQATLPAQVVRLRLLNAETERAYHLGFADGRTYYLLATDGGLVEAPIALTRMKLYPGERAEILVDLTGDAVGATLDLQAFNGGIAFGFPGGEPAKTGEFGSLLNDTTFDLLHIRVGAATANAIHAIPKSLVKGSLWTDADATNARTLKITDDGPGTPFTFDGKGFDESVIDQTVALDAVEAWTIENDRIFDHSFHIHDVEFAIVSRSDGPVADYERGWKDTVRVPLGGSVRFVAKFADYASATDPFMYHCHMANHEDGGLMGQFLVK